MGTSRGVLKLSERFERNIGGGRLGSTIVFYTGDGSHEVKD